MTKKDALIKQALSPWMVKTLASAGGAGLGAIPGVVKYRKAQTDEERSKAKTMMGAGALVGGAAGFGLGSLKKSVKDLPSAPATSSSTINPRLKEKVNKTQPRGIVEGYTNPYKSRPYETPEIKTPLKTRLKERMSKWFTPKDKPIQIDKNSPLMGQKAQGLTPAEQMRENANNGGSFSIKRKVPPMLTTGKW